MGGERLPFYVHPFCHWIKKKHKRHGLKEPNCFLPSLSMSCWLALYTFGQLSPSPWEGNNDFAKQWQQRIFHSKTFQMIKTIKISIKTIAVILTDESILVEIFAFFTFVANKVLIHILQVYNLFKNFQNVVLIIFTSCVFNDQ